jgi:enoyl-CoA hydratase/carnithine racemase
MPADGVARVTIDNAAKRNALDRPILEGLASTLARLDARCVVLTGAGSVFSAGYDIGDLAPERLAEEAADLLTHPFEAALAALDAVEVPVVAALGGHAFGGGLELALACDLRVCAAGARLGMPPARLGVVYAPSGLRRFLHLVGPTHARELFFTGRPVAAERAVAIGLVDRLLPRAEAEAEAVALADEIAGNAPLAVQGMKRIFRLLETAAERGLTELEREEIAALRRTAFESDDVREGRAAFLEKRAPRFSGR